MTDSPLHAWGGGAAEGGGMHTSLGKQRTLQQGVRPPQRGGRTEGWERQHLRSNIFSSRDVAVGAQRPLGHDDTQPDSNLMTTKRGFLTPSREEGIADGPWVPADDRLSGKTYNHYPIT